jgi:hypothetical protein
MKQTSHHSQSLASITIEKIHERFLFDVFFLRLAVGSFSARNVARPGRNCKQDNDIFNGNLLSFELRLRH